MSFHSRPSSAPMARPSPSSPAFIHRDIFSTAVPGGPDLSLNDLSSSSSSSSASPNKFRTPPSKQHKRQISDTSFIPSESKLERWNTKLGNYPLLGWFESHTGIRKVYIASFLLLLTLLLIFRGTGLQLVSVSIGFLYPLHMSLKTIENCTSLFEEISGENRHRHTEQQIAEKRGEIVGQLRKWLVYWVVYGLFNMFETLSDFSLSWLPIYHPLKLLFLLWCFLPQYQGSQLVFDILVRPVLIRHEAAIEKGVQTAHQGQTIESIARIGWGLERDVARKADDSLAELRGSVNRVGRVVRAKSIQFGQAIQKTGEQLLNSQSLGVAAAAPSNPNEGSPSVKDRVAAIEQRSALNRIHEGEEGEPHDASDEGQIGAAFQAASRISAAASKSSATTAAKTRRSK